MQGQRHVHFAGILSTPSSTYSEATLASSPGPFTPPPIMPSPLPTKRHTPSPSMYATSPLPTTKVQMHPVLSCTAGGSAPLSWDLTQIAESALVHSGGRTAPRPVTEELVKQPATTPKVASIVIKCERLPWAITILPRQDPRWAAPYVTVGDVLCALYRALRLGVTSKEFAMPGAVPDHHPRVQAAYDARCLRITDPAQRAAERKKGIKRVDFVYEEHAFRGLSCVRGGDPAKGLVEGLVWNLHCGRSTPLNPRSSSDPEYPCVPGTSPETAECFLQPGYFG
ncbi:hypothetical protein C8Q78DRAFT_994248 [Trametes maxima]|nr:hypothetical protein C8Q78DRAFT_994248 [Trametes maxima]